MASLRAAKIIDKTTTVLLKGKKGDVAVPPIACGTWSWGDTRVWGYKEERDLPNIKEVWNQLNKEKLGFYDGAEVYGPLENERILGKLLKDTPEDIKKDIIIATKWVPIPIFPGRLFPGGGVVGALRKSLSRLGLESVDLYQVHTPWTWFYSIDTIAKGLAECVDLGLTKTVGVSNYSTENMIKMHEALQKHGVPLASNQIEYNLLKTWPEKKGMLAACHERDIVLLAYSPLAMGRLTGKYDSKNPPPSGRMFGDQPWEKVTPLLDALKDIAQKRDVPVSAVSLNWVMAKGAVPLGGARNADQAAQNAKALGWKLSDEEVARLDELSTEGSLVTVQAG